MGCSASKVTDLSGAFCQPCVHGRTMAKLERAKGFEPSTPTLARSCSTTELHPHPRGMAARTRIVAASPAVRRSYAKWRPSMQPGRRPPRKIVLFVDRLGRRDDVRARICLAEFRELGPLAGQLVEIDDWVGILIGVVA